MNTRPIPFLICLAAAAVFIPYIGSTPLFDWDEVNFAECAREMLVSGNYETVQLNYQPFWEKPPLFIWMQALCMNIFGVNECHCYIADSFQCWFQVPFTAFRHHLDDALFSYAFAAFVF